MISRWWKLTRGNIRSHPLRTILTVLGISLGIALVFAVQIANDSVEKSILNHSSKLFGNTDVNITVPSYSEATLSEKEKKTIDNMDEIEETIGGLQGYAEIAGEDHSLFLKGVELKSAKELEGYDVIEGEWMSSPTEKAILINEQMAETDNVSLGDTLTVHQDNTKIELTVKGIVSVVGEGQSLTKQGGIVSLSVSRELFGIEKGYNEISIVLKDNHHTKTVVNQLEKDFGNLDVIDQSEVNETMKSSLADLESGLIFFTVISVVLGGFIIYHTFSVIIAQRTKEIATLRALGANRQEVMKIMMFESLGLGLLGIVTGLILGGGLGYVFLKIFSQIMNNSNMTYNIPITGIIFTFVIGILVTLLASWLPIRKAGNKNPLEAFDQAYIQMNGPSGKVPIKQGAAALVVLGVSIYGWLNTVNFDQQYYSVIFLLFIFAGIVMLIPLVLTPLIYGAAKLLKMVFGFKGQLAALTLLKSKRRAVISVTLVSVSLTMILGITTLTGAVQKGWTEEFRKTTGYDLAVMPDGESLPDEFSEKLTAVDGTDQLTSINIIFNHHDELERYLKVNGVDMDSYYHMNDIIVPEGFHSPDLDLLHSNDGVTISEKVADHMNLDVGDTFTLNSKDAAVELPIAAVYKEIDSGGYTVTVPKDIVDDIYEPRGRSGFFITLKQNVSVEDWERNLQTFSWSDEVNIETLENTLDRVQAILTQMFMPFQAINIISVVTAMLGVASALLISVFERKKEISMLRSIGSDRSQIKSFISMEGGIVGLLGTLIGYPSGLFIGFLLVFWWKESMEATIPFYFPIVGLVIGFAVTMVITVLVSLIPASYAAKFEIVEHIK